MPVSDPPPFELLFRQHAPSVLGVLRGLVGVNDAEECAQETFIAALRSYEGFDGANPRAWLLTIARRKAIDHHRRRGRAPEDGVAEPEDLPAPELQPQLGTAFERVDGLPPKQREAVVLRFLGDLPYRDIATAMRISEPAARRNVHEAVSRLREEMGVS